VRNRKWYLAQMVDEGGAPPPADASTAAGMTQRKAPERRVRKRHAKEPGAYRTNVTVAIIGVGGVLLGAIIGVVSAYIVADKQSHSQAHQSQLDYFRTQRQNAYSSFLVDALALDRSQDAALALAKAPPSPASKEAVKANRAAIDDAETKLGNALVVVDLVGSERIRTTAHAMVEAYDATDRALEKGVGVATSSSAAAALARALEAVGKAPVSVPDSTIGDASLRAAIANAANLIGAASATQRSSIDDFEDAARKDLGTRP